VIGYLLLASFPLLLDHSYTSLKGFSKLVLILNRTYLFTVSGCYIFLLLSAVRFVPLAM